MCSTCRPALPTSALVEAGNFLNARIRGKSLAELRNEIETAAKEGQAELDALTQKIIAAGLASWSGGDTEDRQLIVRGHAHLLEDLHAVEDLERVRSLFDALETKRGVIDLLGRAERAEGVRIFIGSENKLFSLSGSSTIIAPYHDTKGSIVGVIGVIGPTRLNYARVIPMVDYTARVVSKLLGVRMICFRNGLIFGPRRTADYGPGLYRSSDHDGLIDDDGPDRSPGRRCSGRKRPERSGQTCRPKRSGTAADPVAEAKREAAEYKDRLLRTLAEMENLRKRTEREVADARLYGIASFAREVLAVADNMHRALSTIGPELREGGDAQVKVLIEGVELTERELLKALEKSGVKKFSPQGEKFDPNLHQAMFEMETQRGRRAMSRR